MNEIVNGSERSNVALTNQCLGSLFMQSTNIAKSEA